MTLTPLTIKTHPTPLFGSIFRKRSATWKSGQFISGQPLHFGPGAAVQCQEVRGDRNDRSAGLARCSYSLTKVMVPVCGHYCVVLQKYNGGAQRGAQRPARISVDLISITSIKIDKFGFGNRLRKSIAATEQGCGDFQKCSDRNFSTVSSSANSPKQPYPKNLAAELG